MIQRIQSVYLLLTTVICGLFLNGTILKFISNKGSDILMRFNGIYQTAGNEVTEIIEKTIPLTLVSVLIPVLSLLTIFLYKNRKLQMRSVCALIILQVLLIAGAVFYTVTIMKSQNVSPVPGITTFIPVASIILMILAYRGIRKDEEIVKSYDRLR